MPRINIDNLIIFGDSMSDIGNKREAPIGQVARGLRSLGALFGAEAGMRTNDIGRYSDGKNWADFLWEMSESRSLVELDAATTNANSAFHRTLTRDSDQRSVRAPRPIMYCNYAEGGAMGASDIFGAGLGTFRQQADRYARERGNLGLTGTTMHLIWFGLNDLVTNLRTPSQMEKVAEEMEAIAKEIARMRPASHFMLLTLPDPALAVRYAGRGATDQVRGFTHGARVFNDALRMIAHEWPHTIDSLPTLCTVDVHSVLVRVNELAQRGERGHADGPVLSLAAQPKGMPVIYDPYAPDPMLRFRGMVATSDAAPPSEAVYRLIADEVAAKLCENYRLGLLGDAMTPPVRRVA